MSSRYVGAVLLLVIGFVPTYTVNAKDSVYAVVTKGSVWVLLKDLQIAPQRSSVYLQNGEIKKSKRDIDRYHIHCVMDFRMKLQDTPRIIKPAEFQVTSVSHYMEPIDSMMVIYHDRMKLTSASYADVTSITCKVWGGRSDDYPTIEQMKKTMAGYFQLRLKKK